MRDELADERARAEQARLTHGLAVLASAPRRPSEVPRWWEKLEPAAQDAAWACLKRSHAAGTLAVDPTEPRATWIARIAPTAAWRDVTSRARSTSRHLQALALRFAGELAAAQARDTMPTDASARPVKA